MKRIICISGDAASGKTTAAKGVLARLPGWRIVSTGARLREYCSQHDIDPQRISELGDDFHRGADDFMRRTLAEETHLIAEARLVGYLARDMPDALRVFCECPLEVRAARFAGRESSYAAEDAVRLVAERDQADRKNFLHLYGIDFHDPQYYDLIVSTHNLNPDQVADAILAAAGGR
jgi:cytidylate kinase